MHSLRCLRVMQMKTIVIIGFISVSITCTLLLHYSSPHDSLEVETSRINFRKQQKQQHQKTNFFQILQENENELSFESKDFRPALTVPRLAKYCNHAHNHMQGQEGMAPAEYELLAVHTVIRHGDRSPIYKLPKGLSGDLSCLVNTEQYSHVSKVVNFPHVMAQQMAKTVSEPRSFSRWSLYPSHGTCGEGQLTGQGAVQHILNGLHFSERYFHLHKLFSEDDWHQKVLIHSTEVSRTYQSAVAFAYGFLPNFDINKLKIKSSFGVNFCEDKVFGLACQCPKFELFRQKAEADCKSSPRMKNNFQEYKKILSHASSAMDIPSLAIPSPTSLMDGLSGYTCHSKPFPCNANGTCITPRLVEAIWKVIDTKSECLGKSEYQRIYARGQMYGLLHRIARNFNITKINGTNANFHLYSGHDTTITPLITALELQDNVWPGYAHMITFELWRDTRSKETFVRVLQNGRLVTNETIFCRDKTQDHGMCNFQHFLAYLNERNLKSFCYSKESDTRFMK